MIVVLAHKVAGLADSINTFSVGVAVPTSLTGASSASQPHYLVTNTEFFTEGFVVGFRAFCNVAGTASPSVRFSSKYSRSASRIYDSEVHLLVLEVQFV